MGDRTASPDLRFIYADADKHTNEISELYSYTEQPEFSMNLAAFKEQMVQQALSPNWQELTLLERKSVIMALLNQLEVCNKVKRMRAARCILYIAQGCWAEMQSEVEQQQWTVKNVMLLYDMGVFGAFTDLLNMEIESAQLDFVERTVTYLAIQERDVSLADSRDLRAILSVLYTITEVMRYEGSLESTEYTVQIEEFRSEITAIEPGNELLIVKLMDMVTLFCNQTAPQFPLKKTVLLLWKLILVSLGGMKTLKNLKAEKRRAAGLPPQDEDPLHITETMTPCHRMKTAYDHLMAVLNQSLQKSDPLLLKNLNDEKASDNVDGEDQHIICPSRTLSLPWKPKVTQKDINTFLENVRMKFIGYQVEGDCDSLAGLPLPICEGVKTLKELVYTSLAEVQIRNEEAITKNSLSNAEEDIECTPVEMLYQAILPNAKEYMKALTKVLMAAAPVLKSKANEVDVLTDVLPEEFPTDLVETIVLEIDIDRHKEIIVKAVSATLLLLLKHFKLNHIYQFEYISLQLVFANCIPLIKFFKQNTMEYVKAQNIIPVLEFPSCVIGDQEELTEDNLVIGGSVPYSWRNMFSCINILRIINKLIKDNPSRITMLVLFQNAPSLQEILKVGHAMLQLYVLKLLKMLSKYLGYEWRRFNVEVVTAIYTKVRHRLFDDWTFGNEVEAAPWDFKMADYALCKAVELFNNRRYANNFLDSDEESVDNNISSVLAIPLALPDDFKDHYDLWLEQKVFNDFTEWESILNGFI